MITKRLVVLTLSLLMTAAVLSSCASRGGNIFTHTLI